MGQKPQPPPAVHRTILVVDVEGFGDRRRTNPDQVAARDGLYKSLRQAFDQAEIAWEACDRADRGDGVFILARPDVPKGPFAESLPGALAAALREHNQAHRPPQRIRLRMALHAGEVNYDDHGVTASSINLAFRLVDARALKDELAGSSGALAVIVSSWFYEEVVRHSPQAGPAAYRQVSVEVKETTTAAWVCLPDHPYPDTPEQPGPGTGGSSPAAEQARASLAPDKPREQQRRHRLPRAVWASVAALIATGAIVAGYSISRDAALPPLAYNYPPHKPGRSTSPGGACHYGPAGAPLIGNDAVTLNASAADRDGDNKLTTRYIIFNSDGSTAYDSAAKGTSVVTGDNSLAELTLTRSVIQSWHPDGATKEYTYHWYALVTDQSRLTSPSPAYDCYFTYNPLGPPRPPSPSPHRAHSCGHGLPEVAETSSSR